MPTLNTTAGMILASLQAAFVGSTAVPATWQVVVGSEVVADVDTYKDWCCPGMGVVLISAVDLEPGTSRLQGGSLYLRMTVSLLVFRCAPAIDDAGHAPTPAQHAAYASRVLDDTERLMRATWDISAYDWLTEEDFSDPQWAAIPVDGGCGGGGVTFEMAVIGDCPTP